MDMVFVYEDKIARDAEGNYYTGSAFSQEVFDRYLQFFDHITLLMRTADVDPKDTMTFRTMNKISNDRIEVVILPDLNAGIKAHFDPRVRKSFKQIILHQISNEKAVVLRAPSVSGTIAADYCHANNIPYLAEAVGCPWDSLRNHSLKGKIMAPRWREDMKRTLRNADYAVYVTDNFLQSRYPSNGVSAAISDVELQNSNKEILEKRLERIRAHAEKYKIGTAGAVNIPYKGQKYVIEALAALKKQGRADFEYHLAGGGDNSALARIAKELNVSDQVVFDGSLTHNDMFAWLDALDLYIQPSTVESMPRALIEAMSRGVPCLGSSVGDIPYLLERDAVFQKKRVNQISRILSHVNMQWLLIAAEKNYYTAKKYEKRSLDSERSQIYRRFADAVERRT